MHTERASQTVGACVGLVVALVACVDFGAAPGPGVEGWVVLDDRVPTGTGVVFLEKGHVHEGTFEKMVVVDENGYFESKLPVGGPWGVHIYYDNYFYMPLEVEVHEDFVTPVEQMAIAWRFVRRGAWTGSGIQPPDPTRLAMIPDEDLSQNPVMRDPRVETVGPDSYRVSMHVSDPDGNLSVQELVGHEQTQMGLALNPPAAPRAGNYPEGEYSATVYLPEGTDPSGSWWFLVSDNNCENSPVMEVHAD